MPIRPDQIEDLYELSPLQQGMLFHALHGREREAYVEQFSCRIRGPLDHGAFAEAWRQLIARHAVLRTAFVWEDIDKPVQVVLRRADPPITIEDWSSESPDTQEPRFGSLLRAVRERSFALAHAPLLSIHLMRTGRETHLFALTHHHLLLDGWSMPILFDELFALYGAAAGGPGATLPARRPYREFIAWVRRQDLGAAEAFWRDALGGTPTPTPLPLERRTAVPGRSTRADNPRPEIVERHHVLEADHVDAWCRDRQLTIGTLVQAAWALTLSRLTGTSAVLYGTTVAGRPAEIAGVDAMLGLFINTLPIRVHVPRAQSIDSWLHHLQDRLADARQFEHTPLTRIQEWVANGLPLFETLVVVENYPTLRGRGAQAYGLRIEDPWVFERTNYPITLVASPGRRVSLRLLADQARVGRSDIGRLLACVDRAVTEIVSATDVGRAAGRPNAAASGDGVDSRRTAPAEGCPAVGSLSLLSDGERRTLIVDRNATALTLTDDRLIGERIDAQRPDSVAIVAADGAVLTYGQLTRRSNALAVHLQQLGIGAEARVGAMFHRTPHAIVAQLAIMKAGGAFVPLDPAQPTVRLARMAADAGISALLTQREITGAAAIDVPHVVHLDRSEDFDPQSEDFEPRGLAGAAGAGADRLAYLIFTSGSTGRPKGVAVSHGALRNLIAWHHDAFGTTASDRQPHLASPGFDASVWEIWPCLAAGAELHLAGRDVVLAPEALREWLIERRITTAFVPTAIAEPLLELEWPATAPLRQLLTGGDRLRRFPPPRPFRVVNNYGPTEHTVVATSGEVAGDAVESGRSEARLPSIGRPIANTRVYVLDDTLNLVPDGVEGDLYLAGPSLARGYWNAPDLTGARFLPDPFATAAGARMYATGDRARWLPTGELEFAGRRDDQVKIRGVRIELAEIEQAIRGLADVADAAAAVHPGGTDSDRVVGYVVRAASAAPRPDHRDWRAALARVLPDQAVPRIFVELDRLPITAHGKLDRAALPSPDQRGAALMPPAPIDPIEATLASIWEDVLPLRGVTRTDDFFARGGHSLSAVRVLSRIRRAWRIDLPLAVIFDHPVLADLAAATRAALQPSAGMEAPPLVRRTHRDLARLSFSQERIWFLEQLPKVANPYHISIALRIEGRIDLDSIEAALGAIVARHEALRTTFHVVDGQPRQRVDPPQRIRIETRSLSEAAGDALDHAVAIESSRPFDLQSGPLLRALVFEHGPATRTLLLTVHHIAADGWSMAIMASEFTELARAFETGAAPELPPLAVQYADFAEWQRARLDEAGAPSLAYWRAVLDGVPPLELPADRPRPPVATYCGAVQTFAIPPAVASALDAAGRAERATLFMTLLAAYATLLHRYTGQDDFAIGSPVSGRASADIEPLVGCFVNTIAVRVRPRGAASYRALLVQVRDTALDALAHQETPFEQLVEALNPQRDLSRSPIFQTMFVWQNAPTDSVQVGGATWRPQPIDAGSAKFDLTLTMAEADGGFEGSFEYSTALFDPATIHRLARHFITLLSDIPDHLESPIGELRLLDPEERQTLLATWNATARSYPAEDCLHDLLAAQATRTPDRRAVTFAGESLTFAELDARAERLAAELQARGAGPDTIVGVCLERSLELVVALYAIVKAGAAYLPLDPDCPRERMVFMIDDARARFVVTTGELAARVPAHEATVLSLDALAGEPRPGSRIRPAVSPDQLAYVIYTSGSTGQPKGVMVSHRAIVNHMRWLLATYAFTRDDVVLQKTPFSFDASVWEFYAPLLCGGRLVVAEPEGHRDPAYLARAICEHGVTILQVVPSMLALLVDEPAFADCRTLRVVFSGGEPLTAPLRDRFFSRCAARLVNLYGPTEVTIDSVAHECDRQSAEGGAGGVPIGRPVANTQAYVLDARLQPSMIGAVGELYLGGTGLARGYLARPDLTADRFVPDPFSGGRGARLYRTGDLVRQRPDGSIEFLGRRDHQVKLRGFRIELGEIEAALAGHASVRQALVAVRAPAGDRQLVAYVIAATGEIAAPELRRHLAGMLPEYMVPAAFVTMSEWPLTSSGKIDRARLPEPAVEPAADGRPPETAVEEVVAAIWAELLGRDRIDSEASFFDLGGHSLLATRVLARIGEIFRVSLPILVLFDAPTVAAFAREVAAAADVPGQAEQIARAWLALRTMSAEDKARVLGTVNIV